MEVDSFLTSWGSIWLPAPLEPAMYLHSRWGWKSRSRPSGFLRQTLKGGCCPGTGKINRESPSGVWGHLGTRWGDQTPGLAGK